MTYREGKTFLENLINRDPLVLTEQTISLYDLLTIIERDFAHYNLYNKYFEIKKEFNKNKYKEFL